MADHRNEPLLESADEKSDVLSDSTDLDSLLAAILGDTGAAETVEQRPIRRVATPPENRPDELSTAPREARPEPRAIAVVESQADASRVAPPSQPPPADGVDQADAAWAANLQSFLAGVRRQETDASAAADGSEPSLPVFAPPLPELTWREKLARLFSRPTLIVAGLAAVVLITIGALGFRNVRADDRPSSPAASESPAAPAPTPAAPSLPAESASPTPPRPAPTDTVGATAARERPVVRRAEPPPPPSTRTPKPVLAPARAASQPRDLPPAAAPSPTPPQRVVDESAPASPATRITADDSEPPRPANPAPPSAIEAPSVTSPADTATAASPTGTAVAAVRRTAPRLLTGGQPEYPAALRTARLGGRVDVTFTIDAAGRVANVRTVSGPVQLRAVAEAAVRRWRYEPARLGNVPIDTQTSVSFNFDPSTSRRPQE